MIELHKIGSPSRRSDTIPGDKHYKYRRVGRARNEDLGHTCFANSGNTRHKQRGGPDYYHKTRNRGCDNIEDDNGDQQDDDCRDGDYHPSKSCDTASKHCGHCLAWTLLVAINKAILICRMERATFLIKRRSKKLNFSTNGSKVAIASSGTSAKVIRSSRSRNATSFLPMSGFAFVQLLRNSILASLASGRLRIRWCPSRSRSATINPVV